MIPFTVLGALVLAGACLLAIPGVRLAARGAAFGRSRAGADASARRATAAPVAPETTTGPVTEPILATDSTETTG